MYYTITIGGIIDIAIAVVIIASLWVILFGIGYFKLWQIHSLQLYWIQQFQHFNY